MPPPYFMAPGLHEYYKIYIMSKILIGALVCAAVAGVVYYVYNNQEEVEEQLGSLKDKASDALGKAKKQFSKQSEDAQAWAQS